MSEPLKIPLYGDLGTGSEPAPVLPLKEGGFQEVWWQFLALIYRYVTSRHWMMIVWSIPAIAFGMISLLIILTRQQPYEEWSLRSEYEFNVARGIEAKKWEHARVACDALLAREPDNLNYLFQRSLIAAGSEQPELAQSLLERVTPLDKSGVPNARKLRAQLYLEQKQPQAAVNQLRKALSEEPNDLSIKIALGGLLLQVEDVNEGLKLLEEASDKEVAVRIQLAQYYQIQKRPTDAERHFRAVAPEFERRWKSQRRWQDAIIAGQARTACQEWKLAEKVLTEAIKDNHDEPILREALAQVYVGQASEVGQQKLLGQQWKYLERALAVAPNNVAALQQVAELTFTKSAVAESAKAAISEIMSQGQAPASVHLIIGTRAVQDGDLAKAELHLKQAMEHNPNAPVVLNNLAWVLAHRNPPELDQASTVVEAAIQVAPNHPDILDTRAMIRIKQGNPAAAITDLEQALKVRPGHAPYTKRLVEAYRAAGDSATADQLEATLP